MARKSGSLPGCRTLPRIVYVRGGSANPALNPKGVSQDVWIVALDGSAPRRIGEGSSPAVSPRGGRIAFLQGGQIWWAPADGKTPAAPAFRARGECARLAWSPDGARLAFVSERGDHSLIGVYDVAAGALRFLDPSTDYDNYPAWSPDGRDIAFIRIPSSGLRQPRQANREGEPWSIRIASAETGAGREVWRASEGPGSVFREVTAVNQLLWAEGGRLVFPWEADGWTHLYSVPAAGGKAAAHPRRLRGGSGGAGAGPPRDCLFLEPGRYRPAASLEGGRRGRRANRRDHGAGNRMFPAPSATPAPSPSSAPMRALPFAPCVRAGTADPSHGRLGDSRGLPA